MAEWSIGWGSLLHLPRLGPEVTKRKSMEFTFKSNSWYKAQFWSPWGSRMKSPRLLALRFHNLLEMNNIPKLLSYNPVLSAKSRFQIPFKGERRIISFSVKRRRLKETRFEGTRRKWRHLITKWWRRFAGGGGREWLMRKPKGKLRPKAEVGRA